MNQFGYRVTLFCVAALFVLLCPAYASTIVINDDTKTYSYVNPEPSTPHLLVISVYETASGTADVSVLNGGATPVNLVLSAYRPTLWRLTIEPGVIINEIILNGCNEHQISGADGITVTDKSGIGNFFVSCGYAWPANGGGGDTEGLISKLEAYTGLELTAFAGAYRASDFTVTVCPAQELHVLDTQSIEADTGGFAEVILDGSTVVAANNAGLSYSWTWTFNRMEYRCPGLSPTVQLPVGEHKVYLMENNGLYETPLALAPISVHAPDVLAEGELTYTATLTADNYYAVYAGTPENLTFAGQYGDALIQSAETITFNVKQGDYIYVAAWDADAGLKGWLGQFYSIAGTVFSNTEDWEVCLTGNYDAIAQSVENKDGSCPSVDTVMGDLANATWIPVNYSTVHALPSIWWVLCNGYLDGISPEAQWIWGSNMTGQDNSGGYQIFRFHVPVMAQEQTECFISTSHPLQSTWFFWPFLLSLAGMLVTVRRRI